MLDSVTLIQRLPEGIMGRGSLRLPCLLTCLPPPLVGPLLKLWRSQGKVFPNIKGLIWGLIMFYATSSWWHRVPCLRNLHDAWWIRWYLDSPSSPPQNRALQAPSPALSPSVTCLAACPWWGMRGEASRRLLRIWPHGLFGGARFVSFCFVNFCNFYYSTK